MTFWSLNKLPNDQLDRVKIPLLVIAISMVNSNNNNKIVSMSSPHFASLGEPSIVQCCRVLNLAIHVSFNGTSQRYTCYE